MRARRRGLSCLPIAAVCWWGAHCFGCSCLPALLQRPIGLDPSPSNLPGTALLTGGARSGRRDCVRSACRGPGQGGCGQLTKSLRTRYTSKVFWRVRAMGSGFYGGLHSRYPLRAREPRPFADRLRGRKVGQKARYRKGVEFCWLYFLLDVLRVGFIGVRSTALIGECFAIMRSVNRRWVCRSPGRLRGYMEYLFSVVLAVHILAAMSVIGLVLVQHGKGADMGAAFGSGASGSLFGATGSANFLSRATAVIATIFFATSLSLAYLASNTPKTTGSVMQDAVKSAPVPAPPLGGVDQGKSPVNPDSKAKDIPR